jgi:ABC-2 type transport system permease protein
MSAASGMNAGPGMNAGSGISGSAEASLGRMEPPPPTSIALFNFGLVQRAVREVFFITLTYGAILASFSAMLAYVLPRVQERFMRRNFIPPALAEFRNAMFGFDGKGSSVSDIAFSLAWSHPIIIALLAAHAITICTRILAAEVERGTVDVLLALPVSRWRLFMSETAAWLLMALVVLGAIFGGSYFGAQFIKQEHHPNWGRLLIVLVNLGLVYAFISLCAMLAAVLTDRRVRAVMVVLIITVFSVLINFLYLLDSTLEFTKNLRFLSVLEYYRPITTLMTGDWPLKNMGILASGCAALWIATGIVISRRDVTTT